MINIFKQSFNILYNFLALLFGGQLENAPGPNQSKYIGCIDPQCDIVSVIKDAYENARFLCDQYYLASPELIIHEHQHNGKDNTLYLGHILKYYYLCFVCKNIYLIE